MKQKLIIKAAIVGTLLLIAGTSIPGIAKYSETQIASQGENWYEDFDSYAAGSPLHGQGGWEAWDNNSLTTAYVSDAQARSAPNSVEIAWFDSYSADIVQQFTGVDSGTWNLTLWQYIPSDMVGISWIPILNTYTHGGPYDWSTDICFDGDAGTVTVYEDPNALAYMIFNQWVEIRVEIDFESNSQTIYYDGEELTTIPWSDLGIMNLAALDLYAGDVFTNSVYYDDISLEGSGSAEEPELEISDIAGGFGVKAKINNVGDAEATDTEWSIALDGGLIILGKETTGTIASIPAGESADIKSGLIFGIGKTTITVTAECAEGSSDEGTASGFVILFFVIGVS